MAVHPPHAVARASALTNVLRQMFPAFGIAFFATILQTRQAFYSSTLAQTVTPDSLAAVQVISQIKETASQFGASDAVTSQIAVQVLDGLVQQQAAIKAFGDVFLVAAVIALAAVPIALMLRRPKDLFEEEPITATAAPEPAD